MALRHRLPVRLLFVCSVLIATFPASASPVPRILLAGDSWAALMQAFDTYQTVLPEYPGCEDYRSLGFRTAVVGMRASEFVAPAMLAKVAEELALYPTIDVVHLSLGGNDILYGTWKPTMSPAQQQALFDSVTAHVETAIDFILAQRPDIRVGLCGYTFGDHAASGVTPSQANQAILALEQSKLAMLQGKERVFYIHNLGLMQYSYGIPQADPPIPAMSVPYPGGYPDYDPMPGGNMAYSTPEEALVDSDIHLTPAGYVIVARRCMDEFYATWLSWPRVFEVQLLSADAAQAVFQVRFSETVTGVDPSDFAPSMQSGSKALAVLSAVGSGDTYTVTVSLDGSAGTPHLDVLDDDSIVDLDLNPLGGPGTGNGLFTHNGLLDYEDPPPIEEDDFDAFLVQMQTVTAPYEELLDGFSFAPDQCDANGGFGGIDPLIIYGNGLLDSCEFALINACLRNTSLDWTANGGVSHAVVAAAWQNNLEQMREDLGGTGGLALSVLRGLDSILAAFLTLGDPQSAGLPVLLIYAANSYNEFPLDLTVPSMSDYVLLPEFLGFDGDADGDGVTNMQEYQFFMPLGGEELYVAAALNPAITPEPQCSNSEGGFFKQGQAFCLIVPDPVDLAGGFQWYKDDVALVDDAFISGSQWRELHISSLRPEDAGVYECLYADETATFGPILVNIYPVPALQPAGIAILAAMLSAVAMRHLHRRFAKTRPVRNRAMLP